MKCDMCDTDTDCQPFNMKIQHGFTLQERLKRSLCTKCGEYMYKEMLMYFSMKHSWEPPQKLTRRQGSTSYDLSVGEKDD